MLVLLLIHEILSARQSICIKSSRFESCGTCTVTLGPNSEESIKTNLQTIDLAEIRLCRSASTATLNLSLFKDKDVIFGTFDSSINKSPSKLTLIDDSTSLDLKNTSLAFTFLDLSLQTSKEISLNSFLMTKTSLNAPEDLSLSVRDFRCPISNLSIFSQLKVSGNLSIGINKNVNIALSEASINANNQTISIKDVKPQFINILAEDKADKTIYELALSSNSLNAPTTVFGTGGNFEIDEFLSPFIIDAPDGILSLHLLDSSKFDNIRAKNITICLTSEINEFKNYSGGWLILNTENSNVTKALFEDFNGKLEILSSNIDVEADTFTSQMGNYDKSLNIINTIGKEKVSSLTVKNQLTQSGYTMYTTTQVKLRTEFNSYLSVNELNKIISHDFTLIKAGSYSKPVESMTADFTADSKTIGFSKGSSCVSIIVDLENGYKQIAHIDSPLILPYNIVDRKSVV